MLGCALLAHEAVPGPPGASQRIRRRQGPQWMRAARGRRRAASPWLIQISTPFPQPPPGSCRRVGTSLYVLNKESRGICPFHARSVRRRRDLLSSAIDTRTCTGAATIDFEGDPRPTGAAAPWARTSPCRRDQRLAFVRAEASVPT